MDSTQTTAPAVEFTEAGKAYGAVHALRGLTVALRAGETVALLGPNGAGKSTTLDLLLGLRTPDPGGSVRVFGTSPRQALVDGRVGAMLQSGGLMDGVRVRELVALACALHPRGHEPAQVLADAGLTELAERTVGKLSGGQTQRVRFALATAGANDLLVLDEPTTGMDVTARQDFWAAMRTQAAQGRTILFATHYLQEADEVADRVLVLHRGQLLADGTAAEIKARAGARRIAFTLDAVPDGPLEATLRALPGLTELHLAGRTVRIRSSDPDATVHALYALDLYPHELDVAGLGLEEAFRTLTDRAEAQAADSTLAAAPDHERAVSR